MEQDDGGELFGADVAGGRRAVPKSALQGEVEGADAPVEEELLVLVAFLGVAAMFAKTFFFVFFFMWVRWSIPRFRFDQLMNLGWKGLIPLAILNILLTGGWLAYKNGL